MLQRSLGTDTWSWVHAKHFLQELKLVGVHPHVESLELALESDGRGGATALFVNVEVWEVCFSSFVPEVGSVNELVCVCVCVCVCGLASRIHKA